MKTPSEEPITVTVKKDFYECKRCNINSKTKDRMIPCPRGGCEAMYIGQMAITTTKQFIPDTPESVTFR